MTRVRPLTFASRLSGGCIAHVCVHQAKQESISAIFEAAGYKQDGKARRVIVTGCLAQRYAGELANELPEVRVAARPCRQLVKSVRR